MTDELSSPTSAPPTTTVTITWPTDLGGLTGHQVRTISRALGKKLSEDWPDAEVHVKTSGTLGVDESVCRVNVAPDVYEWLTEPAEDSPAGMHENPWVALHLARFWLVGLTTQYTLPRAMDLDSLLALIEDALEDGGQTLPGERRTARIDLPAKIAMNA